MKQNIIISLMLCLCVTANAQPKWLKKALKAQATLHAVQTQGDTLHCPAFFIDQQGTAICPLKPLQRATQAWLTANGTELPVSRILGFDDTYNVARIAAEVGKKKPIALTVSNTPLQKEQLAYIMPQGKEDRITQVEKAKIIGSAASLREEFAYYTLSTAADAALAGQPLMDSEGNVVGILQTPILAANAPMYALDVQLPLKLSISAMDANATCLRDCNIPKALPADEAQARSFLYILSATPAQHESYAQDFIRQFPASATGYVQLANVQLQQGQNAKAQETYEQALNAKTENPEEIYHARSQAIYGCVLEGDSTLQEWTAQQALNDIQAAMAANPQPLYTLHEARVHYAMQDYRSALHDFLSLTKTNMREANLFLYAANCMEKMELDPDSNLMMNDSAVAMFTRPYPSEAATPLWMRSVRLRQMGLYRDAVRDMNDYEHLMAGQLGHAFYYQRHEAEVKSRMFPQAIADIDRAIALKPDEALYHIQRAVLQYRVKETDQAILSCQRAVALEPNFPDVYRIWGICLRDKGQLAEAREKLEKAAALGDELAGDILKEL